MCISLIWKSLIITPGSEVKHTAVMLDLNIYVYICFSFAVLLIKEWPSLLILKSTLQWESQSILSRELKSDNKWSFGLIGNIELSIMQDWKIIPKLQEHIDMEKSTGPSVKPWRTQHTFWYEVMNCYLSTRRTFDMRYDIRLISRTGCYNPWCFYLTAEWDCT